VNLKYTRNFWLLCWAFLFFMVSFNLIIPKLNDFITLLGGGDLKGMNILIFAFLALISRPFAGKLADKIGRKKVMYLGILLGAFALLIYPLSSSVFFYLAIRALHGTSAGFMPTAATALATDIIPDDRRGSAMGIWGAFTAVGFGLGNYFAGWIHAFAGYTGLFMTGLFFCLITLVLISSITETLPSPQAFSIKHLRIRWNDVFEPTVRPAAFVMFCATVSTGMIFVTSSDISTYLHIDNQGHFFLFYMLSTILVRLFGGNISEKIGRRKALLLGNFFLFASMLCVSLANEWILYTVGATLFGLSTGVSSPAVFAWMADLCPEDRRGVGSGTVFIALEGGVIIGSFLPLVFYDNTFTSIALLFGFAAMAAMIALLYLLWHLKRYPLKG
jgi:MFS family permease